MPNWCENHLVILGNKEEVSQFIKDVHSVNAEGKPSYFDFEKVCPTPPELMNEIKGSGETDPTSERGQELISKYGATNWYDWRCANWGTKWSADTNDGWDEPQMVVGEPHLAASYINFDTAWGPPSELTEKMSEKYPSILFSLEYCEPGMSFCGEIEYENGEGGIAEYDWDSEDGKRIREEFGYTNDGVDDDGALADMLLKG